MRTWSNMPHPDEAFSPWYRLPDGVSDEPCQHAFGDVRVVGPTGNSKMWMIRSENCDRCGRIMRSRQDLSWEQYDWVRRWNRRKDAVVS